MEHTSPLFEWNIHPHCLNGTYIRKERTHTNGLPLLETLIFLLCYLQEKWIFYASITVALAVGVLFAVLNRTEAIGHGVVGLCGGGIMGYLFYCALVVGLREGGVQEVGGYKVIGCVHIW